MEQKKENISPFIAALSIILFLLAATVLLLPEGFFEPEPAPSTEPSTQPATEPTVDLAQAHLNKVLSADFPLFYYTLGSLNGGKCDGYRITYADGSEGPMEQMASLEYVKGSHYEMVGWFREPVDLLVQILNNSGSVTEEYYLHIAYNYETEEYEISTSLVEKEDNDSSAGEETQ